MHAIAETVQRARAPARLVRLRRRQRRLHEQVLAPACTARPRPPGSRTAATKLQAEIDGWAAPEEAGQADGRAVIETYTVTYGRDGARAGIVIGRLDADGRRFLARADEAVLDLLTTGEPVGERVVSRSSGTVNTVTPG